MTMKVLAIIPARAGSKRVKSKNTRLINGRPLIWYTLREAHESQFITHVVVTSDCQQVIDIAESFSKVQIIRRPSHLSSDSAKSIDVVLHALTEVEGEFDTVCLLQPTSPLRTSEDIDDAINLYEREKAESVTSIVKMEHSPEWATRLESESDFQCFVNSLTGNRSQELPDYYQLNGAIYLVDKNTLLYNKTFFSRNSALPFKMTNINSVDIDTELDFKIAELLLKERECLQ